MGAVLDVGAEGEEEEGQGEEFEEVGAEDRAGVLEDLRSGVQVEDGTRRRGAVVAIVHGGVW